MAIWGGISHWSPSPHTCPGVAKCCSVCVALMPHYKSYNFKISSLGNSISDKLIMQCFPRPMRVFITYSPTVIYNTMTTRNLSRSKEQQEELRDAHKPVSSERGVGTGHFENSQVIASFCLPSVCLRSVFRLTHVLTKAKANIEV